MNEMNDARLGTHGFQIFREVISLETITSVRRFLEKDLLKALKILPQWSISSLNSESGCKAEELLSGSELGELDESVKPLLTNGHFPLSTRLSDRLWELPKAPGLRNLLNVIFGGQPISMHMPPVARFMLPGNFGAAVPPHRDIDYNLHLKEFFTVWIPLVEIDLECGGISFYIESTNREATFEKETSESGFEQIKVPTSKAWLPALSTNSFRRIVCSPMFPGDIAVFNEKVVHGSELNTSSRTRLSIDMRFFARDSLSKKHSLDLQQWRIIEPSEVK